MTEINPRISDIISHVIATLGRTEAITLGEFLKVLGDKGIVIAILFFSLVNSLPMPGIPFLSTVTGLPVILLAAQLLVDRQSIWLPGFMRRHVLRKEKLSAMLTRLLPLICKLEKWLQPHWSLLSNSLAIRCSSIVYIGLGVLLALPLPFANFPCGFSMSLLSIGLITRDGYMVALSLLCSIATCFLLGSIYGSMIGFLF